MGSQEGQKEPGPLWLRDEGADHGPECSLLTPRFVVFLWHSSASFPYSLYHFLTLRVNSKVCLLIHFLTSNPPPPPVLFISQGIRIYQSWVLFPPFFYPTFLVSLLTFYLTCLCSRITAFSTKVQWLLPYTKLNPFSPAGLSATFDMWICAQSFCTLLCHL